MDAFLRSKSLIGEKNFNKLASASVAVFGVGGVGGFTVEALVRSGVSNVWLFDGDVVDLTNLNRQIIATIDSVGKAKVNVMKERILSINPNANVTVINSFVLPENIDKIDFSIFSYVVDAIDTVSTKIALIEKCIEQSVPVISCMGTGGKLNPLSLAVADISKTSVCPLARVVRRELKKRGIEKGVKVVYSTEEPLQVDCSAEGFSVNLGAKADGRKAPFSMIFVPASAGLLMANQVIKDLINN